MALSTSVGTNPSLAYSHILSLKQPRWKEGSSSKENPTTLTTEAAHSGLESQRSELGVTQISENKIVRETGIEWVLAKKAIFTQKQSPEELSHLTRMTPRFSTAVCLPTQAADEQLSQPRHKVLAPTPQKHIKQEGKTTPAVSGLSGWRQGHQKLKVTLGS